MSPSRVGWRTADISVPGRARLCHDRHTTRPHTTRLVQRLIEVGDDVAHIFDSHRQTNQLGRHAGIALLGLAQLLMRRRSRMNRGSELMSFLPASKPPRIPNVINEHAPEGRYFCVRL